MSTVTTEKGIPIPPKHTRRRKYPWTLMEVGESFAFPLEVMNPSPHVSYANRAYAPRQYRLAHIDGYWRCWRVK